MEQTTTRPTRCGLEGVTREYISQKEALVFLDCDRSFLAELRKDGYVTDYKVRGKLYYSVKELNTMIRRGRSV